MAQAFGLGLAAAATLLVGAWLALARPWSKRAIGLVAGFGVGALISALTLDLTASAFEEAGVTVVVVGLAAGAIVYSGGNWALQRSTASHGRKRSEGHQGDANALGIVLGAVLDGVPESVVIGISLLQGRSEGIAFLLAVAISNLPEALSATTGLARAGWSPWRIYRLWLAVVVVSGVAAGIGFGAFAGAPVEATAIIEAFAAGAILTMLADTMMPEAFEDAGPAVGLATVLGYALGALLTLV
ncbi:MAG TPA: ZIP family metal transporter [Candidatus Limnocylindrales bacterium]|nr:ZIP family metal transporter [Candidatus Limnocylindrales bacterium]